jgi:L-fuculose-phosphate aldolase
MMEKLMSASETEIRQSVIDACIEMNRLGINQGTSGNISVRFGDGMLVTPTSRPYASLEPQDIVFMNRAGEAVGRYDASSEWRFHLDILKARPEVNAIVHTHPTYCTTLAIMGKKIPAIHYMIAVGSSLSKAMWLAVEVETLARQYHGCLQIGEPPLLSEKEIENVIGRMAGYGHSDTVDTA